MNTTRLDAIPAGICGVTTCSTSESDFKALGASDAEAATAVQQCQRSLAAKPALDALCQARKSQCRKSVPLFGTDRHAMHLLQVKH